MAGGVSRHDFKAYLDSTGVGNISDIIIEQPEFFRALYTLGKERPLDDWKMYLRWHLLRATAPFLTPALEQESFAFYGKVLRGQEVQEPRWQRSARVIDAEIGEALGQLFVEKYFPPTARARMTELVGNLKVVFRERLEKLDWMTAATRAKGLAKFDRFTEKIGYPEKFRDYSTVEVRPDDYLGNVERADQFETQRTLRRIGQPVDKTEWHMTPETVNAYFNPLQNEIVFPREFCSRPFSISRMMSRELRGYRRGDWPEITHGYDDEVEVRRGWKPE